MVDFPTGSDPARPVHTVHSATDRVAQAPHAPPAKTTVKPTKDTAVSPGNWSDPAKELHDIEDAVVELETAMQDVASLTSKPASKRALSGPDREKEKLASEKLVSARDLLAQAKKTELGTAEMLRAGAVIAGNAAGEAEEKMLDIQGKPGHTTRELAAAKKESLAKARTFYAAAQKEAAAWKHLAHKYPMDTVVAEFSRRADNDKHEAEEYIEHSNHPEKLLDP
jgi:hypothetical protein